jgi:hypothetical protein
MNLCCDAGASQPASEASTKVEDKWKRTNTRFGKNLCNI